jgi:hypothetical protein
MLLKQNFAVQQLVLLFQIQKILSLNLGMEKAFPDRFSSSRGMF